MVEASPPVDFGVSPVGRVLVVEDDPSPTAWCRPVYGPAALRDRLGRQRRRGPREDRRPSPRTDVLGRLDGGDQGLGGAGGAAGEGARPRRDRSCRLRRGLLLGVGWFRCHLLQDLLISE